jgi:octanoyl-[GcvH]:protein N-octanoyltransferase
MVTQVARERSIRLLRDSFPERPAMDTAVSRALLLRVAAGELPETVRLHRRGPVVAFGRQDVASAGYADAVRASRSRGFEAVERITGGRAAVYHEGTIALAWTVADPYPPKRTYARFEEFSGLITAALAGLGVDARVGEVPGEYCPGAYSVNARGRTKLAGIGQRMVAGAAHVGSVVVESGSQRVRDALFPVYRALGLAWDPETVGSVEDETGASEPGAAERAIIEQLAARYELEEATLDAATLALAEEFEPQHRSPSSGLLNAGTAPASARHST